MNANNVNNAAMHRTMERLHHHHILSVQARVDYSYAKQLTPPPGRMARTLKGKARKETTADRRRKREQSAAARAQMNAAAPYVVGFFVIGAIFFSLKILRVL